MPSSKSIGPYRYQLLEDEPFFETRMSVLWVAEESDPQQQKREKVVLKLARLKEEQYSMTNQRAIENEVNWLRKLHHPGIIKLRPIAQLETGRSGQEIYHARATLLPGEPWFVVTDYLPGSTLQGLMDSRKRLSTPLALQIARHLAVTLAYIHSQGCVHRDFKPNNILFVEKPGITGISPQSQPILIDFGIANGVGEERTMAGTRPWLAPECDQALKTGARLPAEPSVDVYALGLVIYYMLTGQRPPEAMPNLAGRLAVNETLVSDVGPARRAVATGLTELIARTVADEPNRRATAQEVVEGLDELLSLFQPTTRAQERQPRAWTWGWWQWLGTAGAAGLIGLILILANPNSPAQPALAPEVALVPTLIDSLDTATAMPLATDPPPTVVTSTSSAADTDLPTPLLDPTSTDTPAALPTAVPTHTSQPTAPSLPLPTTTPASTTATVPTSTPLPSNTPIPSPTSSPTVTATATPQPTNPPRSTPVPVNSGSVTLLGPLGATLTGAHEFSWSSTVSLAENQAYEMVFWPVGQEPFTDSFGPVGTTTNTTIRVDLDRAAALLPRLLVTGQDYEWGVLLVQSDPYLRLRYLGGQQRFRYEGSGNGGGGGSPSRNPDREPEADREEPTPTPRG